MNPSAVITAGFYTLALLAAIYYYEDKIKDLQEAISDYKRALDLKKHALNSSEHYAYLQLENHNLREQVFQMDADNQALSKLVKSLKQQMAGDKEIQYESSIYKSSIWESTYSQDEIDFEQ